VEREYELMYIVRPDLDDDQVRTTMDAVTSMVAENGGEVLKSSLWGRRRLAYLVGGFHDGYYVVADTRLPGERLGEIERQLKLSESVIRHLLTIARPMRQEGERAARGRERWRDRERGRGRRAAADAPVAVEETLDGGVSPDGAEASSATGVAEAIPAEADQVIGVGGPLEVEGAAAPAAAREETDVPEARPGADDLDDDDDELDEDDDEDGESPDDEDDDDDDDEDG